MKSWTIWRGEDEIDNCEVVAVPEVLFVVLEVADCNCLGLLTEVLEFLVLLLEQQTGQGALGCTIDPHLNIGWVGAVPCKGTSLYLAGRIDCFHRLIVFCEIADWLIVVVCCTFVVHLWVNGHLLSLIAVNLCWHHTFAHCSATSLCHLHAWQNCFFCAVESLLNSYSSADLLCWCHLMLSSGFQWIRSLCHQSSVFLEHSVVTFALFLQSFQLYLLEPIVFALSNRTLHLFGSFFCVTICLSQHQWSSAVALCTSTAYTLSSNEWDWWKFLRKSTCFTCITKKEQRKICSLQLRCWRQCWSYWVKRMPLVHAGTILGSFAWLLLCHLCWGGVWIQLVWLWQALGY